MFKFVITHGLVCQFTLMRDKEQEITFSKCNVGVKIVFILFVSTNPLFVSSGMCDLWWETVFKHPHFIHGSVCSFNQSSNHYGPLCRSVTTLITKWQRNIMQKTNVHIPGISSWIIWLISILNWFKWPFFFPWRNQTGLVCAGQQNKEMLEPLNGIVHCITISFGYDLSHLGLISRGPWRMRRKRNVGWNSASIFIFLLSLLNDTKALLLAWRMDFCSERSLGFFHSSASL